MVWNLVAPRYAYEEVDVTHIASILTAFLRGGLQLCGNEMRANGLKMYLGNAIDRAFARGLIEAIGTSLPKFEFAISAGWLHISWAR